MKKSGTTLIDFDGNRRNNFTTIRIIFAWLVLYGHSFAVQKTPGMRDPLNMLFQGSAWIGVIVVNGFFAISGFLVAASFVKRGLKDYAISRILRIFPALLVCVFISVFVVGPLFTNLSLGDFFSQSKTYEYLANGLAFFPMQWTLPGVFETNARNAINGSLWTLTVEVRCYLLLAIAGFFGLLRDKIIANISMLAIFLFGLYFFSDIPFVGVRAAWSRNALFFLIGVFFYINRDRVLLDLKLACLALILVLVSFGKAWFNYIFPISFVYLIFYSTYKTKYIDTDGKIGDLSYSIYIYAWPVQQTVAHFFPSLTPYGSTLLSSIIVVTIAFFSWHYLEKPMLALKQKFVGRKEMPDALSLIGTIRTRWVKSRQRY